MLDFKKYFWVGEGCLQVGSSDHLFSTQGSFHSPNRFRNLAGLEALQPMAYSGAWIHSFIYSFTWPIILNSYLCFGNCSRFRGYSSEQNRWYYLSGIYETQEWIGDWMVSKNVCMIILHREGDRTIGHSKTT